MSTYRGHYLPVAARREVLKIYRNRRATSTWAPWATGPLPPMAAMHATVDYFTGWLAHYVAFGPVGPSSVQEMTDQYRAAQFYLDRMYDKSDEFKNFGRAVRPTIHGRVVIGRDEIRKLAELAS